MSRLTAEVLDVPWCLVPLAQAWCPDLGSLSHIVTLTPGPEHPWTQGQSIPDPGLTPGLECPLLWG